MEIGVFIPIGNNGWLISSTSPQYTPSFDLNREVVLRAERYGFDFALSMIKLRGFGGKSRFWDDNLESFTLMAGLASITRRIELYATVAVLTLPPPLTARMAMTIDSISHGRFGVNLVTGWQKAEYDQMGFGPPLTISGTATTPLTEYAKVMQELELPLVRPQGQVLHHERLPAGAAAVAADPADLRRHQRSRHRSRVDVRALQPTTCSGAGQSEPRDCRRCVNRLKACTTAAGTDHPGRWRSP